MKITYKYLLLGFAVFAALPLVAQTTTQATTTASSQAAKTETRQNGSQGNSQTLQPVKAVTGKTTLASESPVVTPRPVPQAKPSQQVKLPSEQ